ncbi:proline-rich protein 36-like [Dama dama]|uniref:proline-rich protein 36-like n=1 Tax=Dama dama TaxID=30532 RepID=UPI002A368217|nr:proline-rich protein 36-like [Dama dama]
MQRTWSSQISAKARGRSAPTSVPEGTRGHGAAARASLSGGPRKGLPAARAKPGGLVGWASQKPLAAGEGRALKILPQRAPGPRSKAGCAGKITAYLEGARSKKKRRGGGEAWGTGARRPRLAAPPRPPARHKELGAAPSLPAPHFPPAPRRVLTQRPPPRQLRAGSARAASPPPSPPRQQLPSSPPRSGTGGFGFQPAEPRFAPPAAPPPARVPGQGTARVTSRRSRRPPLLRRPQPLRPRAPRTPGAPHGPARAPRAAAPPHPGAAAPHPSHPFFWRPPSLPATFPFLPTVGLSCCSLSRPHPLGP